MSWFYLGSSGSSPGHRLIAGPGERPHREILRDLEKFDDMLRPHGGFLERAHIYEGALTRLGGMGMSALSWMDRSVDKRSGSNVIVFAPSLDCSAESIYRGFARFFPREEIRFRRSLWMKSQSGDSTMTAVGVEAEVSAGHELVVVDRRVWIPGSVSSHLGRTYFRDENNNLRDRAPVSNIGHDLG